MAENQLEACCRKTLQCFVPWIPVTDWSTLDQNDLTSWLANWNFLLIGANRNFVHAARDLFLRFSVPHYPFLAYDM